MIIQIIGCGKIGSLFAKGLAEKHPLILRNRNEKKAEKLREELGIKPTNQAPQITILAIKPQDLEDVAKSYKFENQILLSTLAGVTLEQLKKAFKNIPIFRISPNLACEYGKGIIGIAQCEESPEKKQMIESLLIPFGLVKWFPEKQLNAMTSLTGSGPAIVAVIIEAMVDSAISMGFSAEDAMELILPMIEGTIVTLQKNKLHPGQFKWNVASPSGMTIAGLKVLEQERVPFGIIHAFHAIQQRAKEISHQDQ